MDIFRQVETSGESLIVTVETTQTRRYDRLHGSVMRYDNPTDSIGVYDWDAISDKADPEKAVASRTGEQRNI